MTTPEVTTVGLDTAVVYRNAALHHYDELTPGTEHDLDGVAVATLHHPGGELLSTFATVNDVHFGETRCGVIEGMDIGPILESPEGDPPYPEVMNRGAIENIAAAEPDAVLVKGDLTADGTRAEYQAFLDAYGPVFGSRLFHVRGNHDGYHGEDYASESMQRIDVPGATLCLIDTTIPLKTPGQITDDQLEWLDDIAATADTPVLVFGHHHMWDPASHARPDEYFGIHPDCSERFIDLVARRSSIRGYFAGHTHRNRVRRFEATGDVPFVEVACVKDYPGTWAEYQVYEGGIVQLHRRIDTPAALAWSEQCRHMFAGAYGEYALGAIDDRCFIV